MFYKGNTKENSMRINPDKTKEIMMICFSKDRGHSDALSNLVINDSIVERVQPSKILGVIVSNDLSWNQHIEGIITKASKRLYVLYQLKRAGVSQKDLLRVYLSVIRPVVEYACPVWHTNLPGYLSDSIEVVQKRALRTIYPGVSYSEAMEKSNMQTYGSPKGTLGEKK